MSNKNACDPGTIILIVIIVVFFLALCGGISWCIYDCCNRNNNKNKKRIIAVGRSNDDQQNRKGGAIYYGSKSNDQGGVNNQRPNNFNPLTDSTPDDVDNGNISPEEMAVEDEEEYKMHYAESQKRKGTQSIQNAYENTKKYLTDQGSKIGKRVEQSFSEMAPNGEENEQMLPMNSDYSNTITQDQSYMQNSAQECGAVWGGLIGPDGSNTVTANEEGMAGGYNGTLNVNNLMPASWRSAEPCSALTDTDTTQWSSYAPSKQGFDNYITTAGSARLAVNTRTAMSRQTGLPNMLKDSLQGGGGPPVPMGSNAMTFNDSDLRQSLLYDATGVYPSLTWC